MPPAIFTDPHAYLAELFGSRAACTGGVARRKRRDIERYVGMDLFRAEMRRRGFTAVENGGQVVVFCNRGPIRRIA